MATRRKKPSPKSKGSSRGKGKSKGWYQGDVTLAAFFKLGVAFILFFLSRVLFYLFNLKYFSGLPAGELFRIFFNGMRFDLSGILLINLPFIFLCLVPFRFRYNRVYQGVANGYFYVINMTGLMVNFIDTIYFRFTLKRLTADIFQYLGVGGDFNVLIPQFLKDFWYVLIAWLIFAALLVWLASRFKAKEPSGKATIGYYALHTLIFAAVGTLSVIGIRGGLQLRPISIMTAGRYVSSKNAPLLLNTPFTIARSFGHQSLKQVSYFKSEKELAKIYTPVHKGPAKEFQPLNVVILIMESFSREHVGAVNHSLENGAYIGFTPFLDSLIGQGYYFDAFANGKTSITGIPSVLSGIPALMDESYIQSKYSGNRITGIAGLLRGKGYTTAFFHGGTNGTMGFDGYTKTIGFEKYFGRYEYNNEKDYDGKWGIRDEEFMQYMARNINTFRQPFVVAFFSLSSHHPYFVPGKYKHKFRKGHLPIQESIMYADYSLSKFFETVRHESWFYNTLFVITADHTSEGYYPYYQTSVGQYAIPLLFYKPGSNLHGRSGIIAQQTDVLPTVLDYLGFDKEYVSFGEDLFDTAAPHFSVHFNGGIYGMMKDGYYIEFDGIRTTALFNLRNDSLQRNNIAGKAGAEQQDLELFLKAYIQQYNNRLIENRLTAD